MDKNEISLAEHRAVAYSEGADFTEHAGKPCAHPDCDAEADYFLCSEGPERHAHDDTYLCADHCETLFSKVTGQDGDEFEWEALTIDGVAYEFGKYSCHEDCRDCAY